MREHYEAIGEVAALAVANGDSIIHSDRDGGEFGDQIRLRVSTKFGTVDIGGRAMDQHFLVVARRAFRFADGTVNNRPHINEAKTVVGDRSELLDFDGSVELTNIQDGNIEYWDGVNVRVPIYAFSEAFDLSSYRTKVRKADQRCRLIFNELADIFDIEVEAQDAGEDDENPEVDSSPTFQ